MRLLSGGQTAKYDDSILDHIFTGIARIRLDEVKEEIVNISSDLTSVSKDFDAYLPDGNEESTSSLFQNSKIKAYGSYVKPTSATTLLTNQFTGIFKYNVNPSIFAACHGQGNAFTLNTGGKNYYNAFHPMGYFSPPYGEIISLSEKTEGCGCEKEVGSCATMTPLEYNQLHGLVSANINASDNLKPINIGTSPIKSKLAAVNAPYQECPPDNPVAFYFQEVDFEFAGGTYAGGSVGNPYNHNPIPSSLDFTEMKLTSRYQIVQPVQSGPLRITGTEKTNKSEIINPANYGTGDLGGRDGINDDLALNNKLSYHGLCNAAALEGQMSAHMFKGGSLNELNYSPAGPLNAASDAPTFSYRDFEYWDFTFKENNDYLPFSTSFKPYGDGIIVPRVSSRGSQLLDANNADIDYWWENRQCPEVVDFLPWSYGATIYDCPRDYFEIPYYAAKGRFGYYGTRFYATCKTPARTVSNDISGAGMTDPPDATEENLEPWIKYGIPTYEIPMPLDPLSAAGEWGGAINVDKGGAITNHYFNGLLTIADREQKYYEWLASSKAIPFWVNHLLIKVDSDYIDIVNANPAWIHIYYNFKKLHDAALTSVPNFLTAADNPYIRVDNAAFEEDYDYYETASVKGTFVRLTDRFWNDFINESRKLLQPAWIVRLETLIENYGDFFRKVPDGEIDHDAYETMIEGREESIRTRYLLNISQGNPIDLFPSNHIYFAFDNPEEYSLSEKWGRKEVGTVSTSSVNKAMDLPVVNRRYFEGTFTKYGGLSGIQAKTEELETANPAIFDNPFLMGNFYQNIHCARDEPRRHFTKVDGDLSEFRDKENPTLFGNANGWLGVGYNEIGNIDNNFSCFTPVFVQNPKNTYCKIGQQPVMRALALDYHTIPEDKMETKYPEVLYWAQQLKLLDTDQNLMYPVTYKWFRVPVSKYEDVMKGDYAFPEMEYASADGHWSCLEGDDGPDCTFVHALECRNTIGELGYVDGNANSYMFLQGVKENDARDYVYFCMAYGRFGFRVSDPYLLEAEKFTSVNVSYLNGGGASLDVTVAFTANTFAGDVEIPFSLLTHVGSQPYQGIQASITPYEETLKKKRYIRAGGGQNVAVGFGGPWIYHASTRSYAPETIDDPRGLESTNHRPIEYGTLLEFRATLTDALGSALYGYNHLPTCKGGTMRPNPSDPLVEGNEGVKLSIKADGRDVIHPRVDDIAQIGLTNPPAPTRIPFGGYASKVPNIGHPGQLYGFYAGATSIGVTSTWQFHQNLGCIKRFGRDLDYKNDKDAFLFLEDISATNPDVAKDAFDYVKDVIITDTTLAGENCGFRRQSLGRNMLYFVEAFDRFYNSCDSKAKYNSPNPAFVAPGVRFGDAPFQYTWVGKPSDTYLKRQSMYGPYAFQWKVMRHNRDRLGNGISEGFYSMGWREKYSLMYDVPAIYGLYLKGNPNDQQKRDFKVLKALRDRAFPNEPFSGFSFLGRRGTRAEGYGYGDIRINCEDESGIKETIREAKNGITITAGVGSLTAICAYYEYAQGANFFEMSQYFCNLDNIVDGECFDPCLSMRYSHGFMPGGKLINHLSAGKKEGESGPLVSYKITHQGRDVGDGTIESIYAAGPSDDYTVAESKDAAGDVISKLQLRGPGNTRYARTIRGGEAEVVSPFAEQIAENSAEQAKIDTFTTFAGHGEGNLKSSRVEWGINPCEQGGSDHCNYLTPVVHVGKNHSPSALVTAFHANVSSVSSLLS